MSEEKRFYVNLLKTICYALDLARNYMFKVKDRNTRTRCEVCLKLKTPERHHCHRSGFFIVNSEHISHLVLVFLLLTLSR